MNALCTHLFNLTCIELVTDAEVFFLYMLVFSVEELHSRVVFCRALSAPYHRGGTLSTKRALQIEVCARQGGREEEASTAIKSARRRGCVLGICPCFIRSDRISKHLCDRAEETLLDLTIHQGSHAHVLHCCRLNLTLDLPTSNFNETDLKCDSICYLLIDGSEERAMESYSHAVGF